MQERIRALMARRKVSVEALAEQAGVSTSTVYHWLSGRCRPTKAKQSTVAKVLGTDVPGLYQEPKKRKGAKH